MLKWLRGDPARKLRKQYEQKLIDARNVQRNGDIVRYSELMAESEEILQQIDSIEGRDETGDKS
ncbi:hypothetical protein Mal4_52480 [Maioricimonas rarisocia]|uniref:Lacal_2735 family protein n=1 Tax=Maioricimonas rarisocia TaxID=2528026 RepID=A0A517ZEF8_9PLAN|nr:DUF6435 family protein [Maioricimonas rarisocia]QDU40885.1 hypothetical protein Mal4_52480 [Maioricimonas rarisocia]